MSGKILIATGGTGGHIYPAIGLAQQLLHEVSDCQILFVGGGLEHNRYFDAHHFSSRSIACGCFASRSPIQHMRASFKITQGIWQSRCIMRDFAPNVVVGFGSYYAFPSLVAAKLMSIPLILHEANLIPGKVNRLLSRWANVTGVHFPETTHLLTGRTIEVGIPLREGFKHASISKAAATAYFGLDPAKRTILIFGGSQGAAAINRIVKEAFTSFRKPDLQVIHIAGETKFTEEMQKFYSQSGIQACVKTYENRMEIAWQAADLAIGRSGAGTIAELLEFEVPTILIPFPRAADNHQEHNADFMVATVGGAVKLLENEATAGRIVECMHDLLKNNSALLHAMQVAMVQYKKRARGRDLCSLVKEYL